MIRNGLVDRKQPGGMTDCFRLLKDGGVDYVITNVQQAAERMSAVDMPLRDTGISSFTLEETSLHLIISRSHPKGEALMKAFDEALIHMVGDGTYGDIVTRHLGADAIKRARFTYPP